MSTSVSQQLISTEKWIEVTHCFYITYYPKVKEKKIILKKTETSNVIYVLNFISEFENQIIIVGFICNLHHEFHLLFSATIVILRNL